MGGISFIKKYKISAKELAELEKQQQQQQTPFCNP